MAPPKKRPPQDDDQGDQKPQNGSGDESAAKTSKSAEERKAKREAARQERLEAARKRKQAKRRKQILIAGGLVLVLIALIAFVQQRNADSEAEFLAAASAADCTDVVEHENEGRDHLGRGETFDDYQTNPPTSGTHNPQPAPWGSYRETVDKQTLVHNLEHGGVVVHYKDLSDSEIDALDSLVDSYRDGVISNPNDEIDAPVAIASWTRSMECQKFSTEVIEQYVKIYCNKGPEKLSTCST